MYYTARLTGVLVACASVTTSKQERTGKESGGTTCLTVLV